MQSIPQLEAKLQKAETSYRLARAARQNKGERLENLREAQARQRRDEVQRQLFRARREGC